MEDLENLKEEQLVDLALKGENAAINRLISRYQTKIFLQIRAQVTDYSIAHDLLQEINIKVFRYLPHFKQHSSFETWLYRITQNTIKNYYRMIKFEFDSLSNQKIFESIDENNTPESNLIGIQLGQYVDNIFTKMPNKLQDCFNLYAIDGLSYEDIAKHLDCPLGTVRSRIHRVRSILFENLNQLL
ncbi:Sigma factor RpoE (sigma 24) [Legionella nautarum]|uniref:Sigma factor RpoE (Sigma 24) n=1 Tax=Legionella nautarum TaxID=45070 RepID=A0A0W0WWJ9_9GAMM|nr:sigma-70 family RNA polymerase sigma factor [Legionella nautarum]KTD36693.1 Sigma factor RpoE (sigma 24) [Legionella nautarum]